MTCTKLWSDEIIRMIFEFWAHKPLMKWVSYNSDVIMSTMASQITSLTIVYSTIYSGADQRRNHSSVSLAFVQGIHRRLVNSLHKWPVTRKMFPFDDVIMWRIRFLMNHTESSKDIFISGWYLPLEWMISSFGRIMGYGYWCMSQLHTMMTSNKNGSKIVNLSMN